MPDPWNADIKVADPPEARHGSRYKVVFRVDDVAESRDSLIARGAVALDTEQLNPPGRLLRCDFVDVEGNIFQITGPDD